MKKLISCAIILLAGLQLSQAQNWDDHIIGQKYPGYIITLQNDTVKGYIRAQYPGGLISCHQLSCIFYRNEKDTSRIKYKPDDIKGYQIAGKFYQSVNYGGLTKNYKNFLLTTKRAGISEHVYYLAVDKIIAGQGPKESQTDFFNRCYTKTTVYHNQSTGTYDLDQINMAFKKKMVEMVSINSDLVTKIENKEKGYRIQNFQKIIEEYNAWYAKNKKQ